MGCRLCGFRFWWVIRWRNPVCLGLWVWIWRWWCYWILGGGGSYVVGEVFFFFFLVHCAGIDMFLEFLKFFFGYF